MPRKKTTGDKAKAKPKPSAKRKPRAAAPKADKPKGRKTKLLDSRDGMVAAGEKYAAEEIAACYALTADAPIAVTDVGASAEAEMAGPPKLSPEETPPSPNKSRLTQEERVSLCWAMATRRHSRAALIKRASEQFGKEVGIHDLQYLLVNPAWRDLLERFRNEFDARVRWSWLSSKVNRLGELQEIYLNCKKAGQYKLALEALDKLRVEIEGNRIEVGGVKYRAEEIDGLIVELLGMLSRHGGALPPAAIDAEFKVHDPKFDEDWNTPLPAVEPTNAGA